MSQFHLLKTRKFWPLFWTQFLGAFNDNFLKNAMVILITFKAVAVFGIPASQMVALAGGVFILPFFLFSATAGQLADKMEKSRLVRWIKLAEIGIMLLAAIGFLSEHFEFLLLVLFLMGLHSTFFGPIKYSILPQHLSEAELVEGNALVEAGTFLAILLGTIAGGVLVSTPNGAGVVSVGLTVVAIIGWLTSRSIPVAPAVAPELEVEWNVARPTLEIYRFTKKNRTVFLSILGISWFWFFGAAVLSLFPPYCKEVLHANQGVVTLFLATFSIGIGLGSMLCSRLSRGHLELGLVPLGSLGISIFVTDLYFVGTPAWALQAEAASVGVMSLLGNGSGWRILFDLLMLSVFSGFFHCSSLHADAGAIGSVASFTHHCRKQYFECVIHGAFVDPDFGSPAAEPDDSRAFSRSGRAQYPGGDLHLYGASGVHASARRVVSGQCPVSLAH